MPNRNPLLKIIFSFLMISATSAQAQYYYYDNNYYEKDVIWEVGASAGIMNCMTDVGGKKGSKLFPIGQVVWKTSQLNASFYVSAMYQQTVGLRLEATWGKVAGADSLGADPNRNLSFKSSINEIAAVGEFHPLMLKYNEVAPMFSPYIALGLGWFSFNPQTFYNGKWVDLQPLRTEGQLFRDASGNLVNSTKAYNLSQAAAIWGGGIKYDVSQLITARFEFLYRQMFTDYLDDVSKIYIDQSLFAQNLTPEKATLAEALYKRAGEKSATVPLDGTRRGNSKTNDGFFSFNFKIGINLGRQKIQ